MLESIHVESYRTLRNTSVTFRDGLNIIIGQNGVGKSNLLEFIRSYTGSWSLRSFSLSNRIASLRSNYNYSLQWQQTDALKILITFSIEKVKASVSDETNFEIYLNRSLDGFITNEHINVSTLSTSERLRYETEIRGANPFLGTYIAFNFPENTPYLSISRSLEFDLGVGRIFENPMTLLFLNHFENEIDNIVPEKFDSVNSSTAAIANHFIGTFQQVSEEIRLNEHLKAFTNIESVRLNPNINIYKKETEYLVENLVLQFMIDGSWMPWSYLSDGTKRSFYLIAEVANAQNSLVLIEEPEIGLHPFQLQKVMTFLKEQSANKQIILSTHSPQVLNILEPDELDQILIASISKGRTSFNRLTDAQKEKAKLYMTEVGELSDYWLHSDLETEKDEEYQDAA